MITEIDWETAWAAGIDEMSRLSTTNYWNRRAEDYSDMVMASDCNHGRNILSLIEREGLLQKEWHILDIASGPGAITIPFAEQVCRATAVEPAEKMAEALLSYAQRRGITNIDIIPQTWQEVDECRPADFTLASTPVRCPSRTAAPQHGYGGATDAAPVSRSRRSPGGSHASATAHG